VITDTPAIQPPSNRPRTFERFSATLILLAGVVFLALWLISIFSERSAIVNVDNDKISLSRSDLLAHLRTVIIIFLSLAGSILIFRKRRAGWMMGTTVLILFLIICSGGLYQAIRLNDATLMFFAGFAWLILFFSLILLIVSPVRRKYGINAGTFRLTFILAAMLGLFYFFVQ
jgi:hypothetical protein